jgi:hypothetical protein
MTSLDALSDEALARTLHDAVSGLAISYTGRWESRPDHERAAWMRVAVRFRDHILRVLAEQAGDPEALWIVAKNAHEEAASHPVLSDNVWAHIAASVAARVAARYAVVLGALCDRWDTEANGYTAEQRAANERLDEHCSNISAAAGELRNLLRHLGVIAGG